MNDELRSQLKRLDPMRPDVPTESLTTPSSRARLEHIMSTPTIERPDQPTRRTRTPWYAAVAAVAVIAVAIGGVVSLSNDGSPAASEPLTLTAGAGDAMASCIAVSADILADMEVAFEGTVTDVAGPTVTLSIDRWFVGGDAEEVIVTAPAGFEALIGGITFEQGGSYLVSATSGVVNYCGYSGPSTPELTAVFEQAFPG